MFPFLNVDTRFQSLVPRASRSWVLSTLGAPRSRIVLSHCLYIAATCAGGTLFDRRLFSRSLAKATRCQALQLSRDISIVFTKYRLQPVLLNSVIHYWTHWCSLLNVLLLWLGGKSVREDKWNLSLLAAYRLPDPRRLPTARHTHITTSKEIYLIRKMSRR